MVIPIITYARGEQVIWRPPNELFQWTSQYNELVRLYGEGPFTVQAIETTRTFPHQRLVLTQADGCILPDARGEPRLFDASRVKKVE